MQDENQMDENPGKIKEWFQDNLRIIVSIVIVVAIAGGIYSYSKRVATPVEEQKEATVSEEVKGDGIVKSEEKTGAASKEKNQVSQTATSQETENAFIETAGQGDGMTHLARRALANYLEKNSDSTLTAEHKIYIEDYLRKQLPRQRIFVGTSLEFSKDMVQKAIEKSKTLNEGQLKNLHKYAVRVPSLS